LLKLLGSELKSSERRKPQSGGSLGSGEGLEEVGNSMDFGGEL